MKRSILINLIAGILILTLINSASVFAQTIQEEVRSSGQNLADYVSEQW